MKINKNAKNWVERESQRLAIWAVWLGGASVRAHWTAHKCASDQPSADW